MYVYYRSIDNLLSELNPDVIETNVSPHDPNESWWNYLNEEKLNKNDAKRVNCEQSVNTIKTNQISQDAQSLKATNRSKNSNREGVRMNITALRREICIKNKLKRRTNKTTVLT